MKSPNLASYPKEIQTVVHVLYSDSIPNSHVEYEHIVEAIEDLNNQFVGTDFSFNLVGTTYTEVLDYLWGNYYIDGNVCFYNSINSSMLFFIAFNNCRNKQIKT